MGCAFEGDGKKDEEDEGGEGGVWNFSKKCGQHIHIYPTYTHTLSYAVILCSQGFYAIFSQDFFMVYPQISLTQTKALFSTYFSSASTSSHFFSFYFISSVFFLGKLFMEFILLHSLCPFALRPSFVCCLFLVPSFCSPVAFFFIDNKKIIHFIQRQRCRQTSQQTPQCPQFKGVLNLLLSYLVYEYFLFLLVPNLQPWLQIRLDFIQIAFQCV